MTALTARLRSHFATPAHWIDALLIFVPVAILLALSGGNETLIFITAALGIIPLASLLGDATDALAIHMGPQAGALLNATFGNAAELIITIAAIRAGLLEVVKASITGSILGNMLLVLGLSVLAGGLKNGFQHFDRRRTNVSVTMLAIAVIGLVIPSLFSHSIAEQSRLNVEYLSIGVAIALILAYALTLLFTLRLPPRLSPEGESQVLIEAEGALAGEWGLKFALAVLVVAVLFVAVLSEILVNAVEPLIKAQGLTELFVGVIIVPIIGNAAEHLVAMEMAWQNKMELALGIALGSSLQIALFVAPLLVFISLLLGTSMTLVFNPFELAALAAAVILAALISLDGESNWLEGAELLIVYVILALAFFYLPT